MHSHKLIAEHFRADSADKPGEEQLLSFGEWSCQKKCYFCPFKMHFPCVPKGNICNKAAVILCCGFV